MSAASNGGDVPSTPSEPQRDVDELRGLWLSRLMFNQFVGLAPETRTFDQFLDDHAAAFTPRTDGWKPLEGEF